MQISNLRGKPSSQQKGRTICSYYRKSQTKGSRRGQLRICTRSHVRLCPWKRVPPTQSQPSTKTSRASCTASTPPNLTNKDHACPTASPTSKQKTRPTKSDHQKCSSSSQWLSRFAAKVSRRVRRPRWSTRTASYRCRRYINSSRRRKRKQRRQN